MSNENLGTVLGKTLVAHLTHARPQRPNLLPYFTEQRLQPVAFTAVTNTRSTYGVHLGAYGMPELYEPTDPEFSGSYWIRPGSAMLNGVLLGAPGFVGIDDVTSCLIVVGIANRGTREERRVPIRRSSSVRGVSFKFGA